MGNPGSAQSWNGYSYVSNSPMSFVDPSGLSQRPVGCGVGGFRCRGQGATGGGFGLASVVSTHWFQWVDIFVSARIVFGGTYGRGHGPGVLDGWWDFMDPFVEVYHQYVHRQGIRQVTSRVPVSGVLNITGKPMGLPGVDFGHDGRLDPQTGWGRVLPWLARLLSKKPNGNKPKEPKSDRPKPEQEVEPTPVPRPTVTNERLRNTVNQLYREGDQLPGGTAGAVRYELRTGELVGGRSHVIKARERIANLERILREESLSPSDRTTAIRLRDDLKAALETTRGPR